MLPVEGVLIRAAGDTASIAQCRELFVEYQEGLGVSLCFQGFEREVARLPGDYAPPRGGLWLALVDGELAGCVALRALAESDAEMKRLYVRSRYRGRQLGRALAEQAIRAAREKGYRTLKLDTLPAMTEAQRLYAGLGFAPTAAYNDNPVDGVRFLALAL